MHTLLALIILIASYVWSGATSDGCTDLLERRTFSTILFNVTPNSTVSTPTSSIAIPPVQITYPISQPVCRTQRNLGLIPQDLSMTDGQVSPNSLLYRIRQMICNGTCSVPQGVPSNDVAIAQNGYCEISIGVTNTLEAWIYSGFPPVGVEQQECWNSTQSIIDQCVRNQANTGWWNGSVILNHLTVLLHLTAANDSGLTLKQRPCISILSGRLQVSQRPGFDTHIVFFIFHHCIFDIDDCGRFFVDGSVKNRNANNCIPPISTSDVQRRRQYWRAYSNSVRNNRQ